jgi:glycosyltransferase involved in cell wall biosynthesis
MRIVHALRYRAAGLRGVIRSIEPDIVHAHFVVEHGFYAATAGVHPLVVTAWGSDVLVEPKRDPISNLIARWTLRRADLITSNNRYMADCIIQLGAASAKVHVVTLGADRYFTERCADSVNVRGRTEGAPCVLSTRAHEPLYNINEIITAYGQVVRAHPNLRLAIAHGGSTTASLQRQARDAGGRVEFMGFLDRAAFRDALADAEVFVSVPNSDGTSVALLQAMAAGCFPIVSDLPTQRELVDDGVNGFRVPLHRPDVLAERIGWALADAELRCAAAERNRALVEERGLNENEMRRMEDLYRGLRRYP